MTILFDQSFISNIGLPFGFNSYRFGYSERPLISAWNADGPDSDGGSYRITLTFQDEGEGTNFDIHFQRNFAAIDEMYVRMYCKVSADFDHSPGANWKYTYHYDVSNHPMTCIMRDAELPGHQPAFTDPQTMKTEECDTFYWANYIGQWVCIEYWMKHSTHQTKLWVTTPDHPEDFNETLYIDTTNDWGLTDTSVIKFGAYWDGAANDTWLQLSRIVVADEYIGPLGSSGTVGMRKGIRNPIRSIFNTRRTHPKI